MKSWNLSTIHFYTYTFIIIDLFADLSFWCWPIPPNANPVFTASCDNEFPPSLHHFNLRLDIHLTFPGDKDLRSKKKHSSGPGWNNRPQCGKGELLQYYICMNQAKTWNQSRLSNINLKPSHPMAVFHTCSSQLWHNLACSSLENQISILVLGTT